MFWVFFNLITISFAIWFIFRGGKKREDSSAQQTLPEPLPVILETQPSEIQLTIQELNKNLPLHSMWDGFWIHELYKDTLTISCSFDRIYYRNFDIIFNGVIFFNVPIKWRDTNIVGDNLLRLATKEEFSKQQPDFDSKDLNIFAIDIHFRFEEAPDPNTFYVVAQSVKLFDCSKLTGPDAAPGPMYEDPYPTDLVYSKRNKMP